MKISTLDSIIKTIKICCYTLLALFLITAIAIMYVIFSIANEPVMSEKEFEEVMVAEGLDIPFSKIRSEKLLFLHDQRQLFFNGDGTYFREIKVYSTGLSDFMDNNTKDWLKGPIKDKEITARFTTIFKRVMADVNNEEDTHSYRYRSKDHDIEANKNLKLTELLNNDKAYFFFADARVWVLLPEKLKLYYFANLT
jgi:hypothetical protein